MDMLYKFIINILCIIADSFYSVNKVFKYIQARKPRKNLIKKVV